MAATPLPFELDPKYDLFKILETPHEIPYHSRPFMWTREKHIEHVIMQSVQKYRDNAQHWLGYFIIYTNSSNARGTGRIPCISDAQHRLTVFFLMFLVSCELLGDSKELRRISMYGSDDLLGDSQTPEDAELMSQHEWTRMPNIRSIYEHDLEALGNLLNGRRPAKSEQGTSNLYSAHTAVREILQREFPATADLRGFLQFIYKNSKVSRMLISDWNFALEVFDTINNIKVTVPPVFLLKNALVRSLGEEASELVHDRFQGWERQLIQEGPAAFDQFIHLMANLFSRRWATTEDYPRAVMNHIQTLHEADVAGADMFAAFTGTVEKGFAVRRWLTENPYARILTRFAGGHEVVDHCLFPMLFHSPRLADREPFVRCLIAYGLRYDGKFSFNASKYRAPLIGAGGPIAALIESRETVAGAIHGVRALLLKWLEDEAQPFQQRTATDHFKTASQFNKARAALLYIAERTDAHEATLDHGLVDIDHISPKQPRKSEVALADPENTHRIGNFTPIMGKNSAAGMKGNRSLGNAPYAAKRESYGKSNIAMTRRVAEEHQAEFADAQINSRSLAIAALLDKLTLQDLASA